MTHSEFDILQHQLRQRFVKAMATYGLLVDDDKVLVAVSGGKDSLLLLEMLAWRATIHHPRIEVVAAHVRMRNVAYETNTDYLEQFCASLGVPLHVITTGFEPSKEKPACFLCSWNRRKQLFNLAQELCCNKIALGHHQDDVLHTALLNLFYQGRFEGMPPMLEMEKMPLALIRPLCLTEEALISRYAQLRGYVPQIKTCPYEQASHRADMRALLEQLQKSNPEVRHSIWKALKIKNQK